MTFKWFKCGWGLLGLLVMAAPDVSANNLTALVSAASGRVAFMKEGTKQVVPVEVGVTRLVSGDVLMTGPNSRATLQIDGQAGVADAAHPEKSTVEVDAKTKVLISNLFADVATQGETVEIGVGQGRVICNVRKINTQSERFEVQTPTVVAAVRGTNFATDVQWENKTPKVKINVSRGSIDLLDFRGTRLSGVNEGETADIDPSGGVSVQPTGGGGEPKGAAAIDGRSGGVGGAGTGGEDGETLTAPPSDDENDDTGGRN